MTAWSAARRWVSTQTLAAAALVLLCAATVAHGGQYSPKSLITLIGAIVVTGAAVATSSKADMRAPHWVLGIAAIAAAATLYLIPTKPDVGIFLPLIVGIAGTAVVKNRLLWMASLAIALGGSLAVLTGSWHWGHSTIDVFASITNASSALVHGSNPYHATFPMLVQDAPGATFYTRPAFFQYGPAVAILFAPAQLLGDVRLLSLLCWLAIALILVGTASGASRRDVAMLLVAFPLATLMILNAWVDMEMAAAFVAWLALRRTHAAVAAVILGIGLAIKPTIAVALIPCFVWSAAMRREIVGAALTAALIALPFALITGPAEFYRDIVSTQVNLPFRTDALTVNSWLFAHGHGPLPGWAGVTATAVIAIAALCKRPRYYSDLLLQGTLIMLVFLLLAKWAFYNYYFVAAVMLMAAIAWHGKEIGGSSDVRLPLRKPATSAA